MDHRDINSHPLVSFCLKFYNQREFVEPALRGAFAQTYSPLEIVISDNHSDDGSWELIQQLVEEYRRVDGRHAVVLNSNSENIGAIKNFEKLVELSHGELCIQADGDDISLPNRAEILVCEWVKGGKKATLFFNDFIHMDVAGNCYEGPGWEISVRHPQGAMAAYARSALLHFKPVVEGGAYDDNVFARRAYLYGDVLQISDKLVKYRLGAGDTSTGSARVRRIKIAKAVLASVDQTKLDLQQIDGDAAAVNYGKTVALVDWLSQRFGYELSLYTHPNLLVRLGSAFKLERMMNDGRINYYRLVCEHLPEVSPAFRAIIKTCRAVYASVHRKCMHSAS